MRPLLIQFGAGSSWGSVTETSSVRAAMDTAPASEEAALGAFGSDRAARRSGLKTVRRCQRLTRAARRRGARSRPSKDSVWPSSVYQLSCLPPASMSRTAPPSPGSLDTGPAARHARISDKSTGTLAPWRHTWHVDERGPSGSSRGGKMEFEFFRRLVAGAPHLSDVRRRGLAVVSGAAPRVSRDHLCATCPACSTTSALSVPSGCGSGRGLHADR